MKSEDLVNDALAQLRSEHRRMDPPAFLSARLRAKLVQRAHRQRYRGRLLQMAAAACAALILMIALHRFSSFGTRVTNVAREKTAPVAPKAQMPAPAPTVSPEVNEIEPNLSNAAPGHVASRPQGRTTLRSLVSASSSGFIDLPSSAMLPAPAETTLVRLAIRKGDLRQFGLDVPEPFISERAQAEFTLGEDGLARSVRLVEPVRRRGVRNAKGTKVFQ
jgi:hypothetical protein